MPARSGSTSGANVTNAISVKGLSELRRALGDLGPGMQRELARANRGVAKIAEGAARREARRMGGVQAKAANAIKAKGTQREARLSISPSSTRTAMANVAFWGSKRRTGWYGAVKYQGSGTPQHPEWVGNTWDVAVRGQGPYAINDALVDVLPELIDAYGDALMRLARDAFPDP